MNNKYGEHPKKKICVFKDHENNQQKEEDKDNENNEDNQNYQDNQNNKDHEQIEYDENKEINENNESSSSYYEGNQHKKDNQYKEDHEDYEDNENNAENEYNDYNDDYEEQQDNQSDEFDLSVPRYSCDNNGKAKVFLLGDSAKHYNNPDHYDGLIDEYCQVPKKFKHTDKNYVVKELKAEIDFKEIQINDIQELKINQFYFNNLIEIKLSLFLDKQFEPQAVKFIQSILNLQTLKKFFVLIVPKFGVEQEEYVEKIQKQLVFKNYITSQSIFVYNSRRGYYGFEIFSDEEKIKKLFFDSFAEIKLDIQQLESVEELEMHSECDSYSCRSMNGFLKKLINLKYLKLNFCYENDELLQMELLQSVCELKQIKKLELNCKSLPSENIEFLSINFEDTMMTIQNENLCHVNISFSLIGKPLNLNLLKQQLSTLKNIKTLKMVIHLQGNRSFKNKGIFNNFVGIAFEKRIRKQVIKQFKKLLKLEVIVTVC